MTMFMITETPEFWTGVMGNPQQRNSEEHADRIVGFLQTFKAQHAVVAAAQLPDGTLVKLDGHTRCLLWEQKRSPVPIQIYIEVFPAGDMEHAKDMYDMYDNRLPTKHAKDGIFGAFREAGVTMHSPFLNKCRLASTLRNVCEYARGVSSRGRNDWDVRMAALEWVPEFVSLDSLLVKTGVGSSPIRLHSGIVGAMLLSIRKYGLHAVEDFWTQFLVREAGMTNEPAMKMREILGSLHKGTGGRDTAVYLASKALSCLEHHMAGNKITKVYGVKIAKYLTADTNSNAKVVATRRNGISRLREFARREELDPPHGPSESLVGGRLL